MMPILSMSEKELDFMVETVYRAIQEVSIHKGLIPAAN
jgi:adenosylmethionine-8-amino-7-oxononanoate aminotransferase